jgi:hypothetical protein
MTSIGDNGTSIPPLLVSKRNLTIRMEIGKPNYIIVLVITTLAPSRTLFSVKWTLVPKQQTCYVRADSKYPGLREGEVPTPNLLRPDLLDIAAHVQKTLHYQVL